MWGASRRVGAVPSRYLANIVITRGQYNCLSSVVPGGSSVLATKMAL